MQENFDSYESSPPLTPTDSNGLLGSPQGENMDEMSDKVFMSDVDYRDKQEKLEKQVRRLKQNLRLMSREKDTWTKQDSVIVKTGLVIYGKQYSKIEKLFPKHQKRPSHRIRKFAQKFLQKLKANRQKLCISESKVTIRKKIRKQQHQKVRTLRLRKNQRVISRSQQGASTKKSDNVKQTDDSHELEHYDKFTVDKKMQCLDLVREYWMNLDQGNESEQSNNNWDKNSNKHPQGGNNNDISYDQLNRLSSQLNLLTFKKMKEYDNVLREAPSMYDNIFLIKQRLYSFLADHSPNDLQNLEMFIEMFDEIIAEDVKKSGMLPHQYKTDNVLSKINKYEERFQNILDELENLFEFIDYSIQYSQDNGFIHTLAMLKDFNLNTNILKLELLLVNYFLHRIELFIKDEIQIKAVENSIKEPKSEQEQPFKSMFPVAPIPKVEEIKKPPTSLKSRNGHLQQYL